MKRIFVLEEPINNIKEPSEVFNRIKRIRINYTQENFIVICLNTKNQVLNAEVLFKGGTSGCFLDPKVIFRYDGRRSTKIFRKKIEKKNK